MAEESRKPVYDDMSRAQLIDQLLELEDNASRQQDRLRGFIEDSLLAIQVIGKGDARSYANNSFLKLFGYADREEFYKAGYGAHTAPYELGRLKKYRAARKAGKLVPSEYEFDARKKDGTVFPVRVFVRSILWDGMPAFERTYVDLTQRKRAEATLNNAIAAMSEGFALYDAQERLVLCNEKYREFFPNLADILEPGIAFEDFVRAGAERGLVVAARGRVDDYVRERMAKFRNPAGPFEYQQSRGNWIRSEEKRIPGGGTVCIRSDITEIRRSADALRESEAMYTTILDNMPAPISLKSRDGRYLFVNRIFAERRGLTAGQIIGKKSTDLWPGEIGENLQAGDQEVVRTGTPVESETRSTGIDGVHRYYQGVKFPIFDNAGSIVNIGSVHTDITERHKFEEQLRQAQKMEAVGQLTGGVAHDFNNLLGIIIGNLDLVAETLDRDDPSHPLVTAATKAALIGADLNRQLLAFSRQQPLSPKAIDVNEHVSSMLGMLRRTLGETIEIREVQTSGLWPALADPAKLESALLNLAVNARDAMRDGGTLTIETANVALDKAYAASQPEVAAGDYVKLSLSDTGSGMDPDTLEHAFEPFFTTKTVGEGTGLGLSMVFGFAKQSRGHVTLQSAPGRGTTVTLYLPRTDCDGAAAPDRADPMPAAAGECVLVVEDDPELRGLVVALLDDLGYAVLQAGNGEEALASLASSPQIDLLLTDVVLPGGMGGPEIAEAAKRQMPGIRVLFMSGYPRNTVTQQNRLDDGMLLLEKPFRKAAFAQKIREAMAA